MKRLSIIPLAVLTITPLSIQTPWLMRGRERPK